MKSRYLFFLILLIFYSCGTNDYKIKKFKNKIPYWYITEKKETKYFYGKATADSQYIEMANRKATGLAIGSILLKIKNNSTIIAKQFIEESNVISNKKVSEAEINSSYQERITQAVKSFKVKNYEVVNREIFRKNSNYKVFIEVKISKNDLFEYLDQSQ
tara:strand:- start:730 stop:1206 length:477 start_codon:yes stop_codon:yes gene_type:complete